MEDTRSVASLMDSTSSKIQQLQKAFAELESQRAVTLNLKWKELEEHFNGLGRSLKRRFHELEDQEKVGMRIVQSGKDFADLFLGAQREASASFGVKQFFLRNTSLDQGI